jgi:hypothetical protein
MNAKELRQHLDTVLGVIGIDRVLTKYVFILARGYHFIAMEMYEVVYSKNRTIFSRKQVGAQEKFYEIRKQIETFPLGQIFHEAIQLVNTLDKLQDTFEDNRSFRELKTYVERFYKAFEAFARAGDDQVFAQMMIEANFLYSALSAMRQAFQSVFEEVSLPEARTEQGQARLELAFSQGRLLPTTVLRMVSVEQAYQTLCELAGVSLQTYPLRVVHMENTDELWLCAEGERHVMALLTSLMERYCQFLYRRLTLQDQSSAMADKVMATQSLVNLVDELERSPFQQKAPDEEALQQIALHLRKQFIGLVACEPLIRINGHTYAADEPTRDNFMAEGQGLLQRYHGLTLPLGHAPVPAETGLRMVRVPAPLAPVALGAGEAWASAS